MNRWLGLLRSVLIYNNPIRRRSWSRFYKTILTPGDLVFDVGAHVGSRSKAMRSAGAKVIAIEPQQPFASFLKLTLPKDILLIQAAAGSSESEGQMAISSLHPTVSSMRTDFVSGASDAPGFEHVKWDKYQSVQVTTLDHLISEHGKPAFIKIDVEGFELDVLSGLSEPIKLISVEFLPGFKPLTLAVLERLSKLGNYEYNLAAGESGRYAWPKWLEAEAVKRWIDAQPAGAGSADLFARAI